MLCTADKPGACNPSIGSGGAGSALATGVTPPSSSAADEPTAATAPVNVVLIDDMVAPIRGCGCRGARAAAVTAGRTAESASARGLRRALRWAPLPARLRLARLPLLAADRQAVFRRASTTPRRQGP